MAVIASGSNVNVTKSTYQPSLTPEDDDGAFHVFWLVCRPGYLVALFLVCWAFNVHIFGRFRVDYFAALGLAKDELVSPQRLVFLAMVIGLQLSFLRFLALNQSPSLMVIAWILVSYLVALLAIFSWLPAPLERHFRWRIALARALSRCLWPDRSKEVPFLEVLVADGLTSMAKVFFDLAVGSCVVAGSTDHFFRSYFLDPSTPDGKKRLSFLDDAVLFAPQMSSASSASSASVGEGLRLGAALEQCQQSSIPFLAWAGPFLIRAQQCIVSSRNAQDGTARTLHLVNLLKYLSSLPIIAFAFCYARAESLQVQALSKEDFEALWAAAAVLNSAFTFTWDLVMDWGLMQPAPWRSGTFGLRPVLFYRGIWGFYHLAIVCNLLGRTLWSLRWSPQVTALLGGLLLSSLQQAAEVMRRGLWNVLRVEWECIKKNIPRTDKHFPV